MTLRDKLINTILSERVLNFIAWRQYEFSIGWNWMQYPATFISFETFAMVFCTRFDITGMWAAAMYALLPIAGFAGGILFGKLSIKTKYQERYLKICADMNPDWKEAINKIKQGDEK